MKVSIVCQGRFHMFDLARQMDRLNHLRRLYTGYPRFKVKGLPPDKVKTFPWLMGPFMAAGRFGFGPLVESWPYWITHSLDNWISRTLEPCDVFHFLSSTGVRSLQIARERYGALTVCDRGSSHILYQYKLLAEEYDRLGIPLRGFDERIIERELEEYESADLICVPSTLCYRSFAEQGSPSHKLRINPYGVELDVFRPVNKVDDLFRIVYVGALSIRKGITYLLEAIAGLNLVDCETWLIGPHLPEVNTILARYENSFKYIGVVGRDELHRYYSQASVFVMPSIEEGLALVQAQAMACGVPIIATTNTGADDLFTDGVEGFIVPIRDPMAIREKLLLLYSNPELRKEMSRAALRCVRRISGWNDYGHRAERIYADELASRGVCSSADIAI